MKIVRLIEKFPKEITGGIVPNAFYISKNQILQGHDVQLLAFNKEEHQENINGIPVHYIKKPRLIRFFGGLNFYRAIMARELNPDIIHGLATVPFGWLFPFFKNKIKTKWVMSVHSTVLPIKKNKLKGVKNNKDSFFYQKLMKFLAKKIDYFLPISDFIEEELEEIGVNKKNITVIPPGLNFHLFNKVEEGKENKQFTIINVGRFSHNKGIPYLINAVDQLKEENVKLILVGGRPQENDYQNVLSLIKEKKLEKIIKVIPPISYQDLPKYYKYADVFVLSSILEPKGKVVLEAMAAGIPVIATNQGGVPEMVEDYENGLLVPVRDSQAIRKAIIKIKQDQELRKRLINNGIETAQKYDWANIADKYTNIFEKICA